MWLHLFLIILALVILYYGAEFSLDAAEIIGSKMGLSSLSIGLLLVGFGTSLPELFVSHLACLSDKNAIAIGNIIGSNISNIFLILGITTIWCALPIRTPELKFHLKLHLLLTIILALLFLLKSLYLISGITLLIFFIYFLYTLYRTKLADNTAKDTEQKKRFSTKDSKTFFKLIVGLILLYAGGELVIKSATILGGMWGVSDYIMSALLIAFGTSFPELMTSLVACLKKKDLDLITGNIIGSNIFNVAFVLGSISFYNIPLTRSFHTEFSLLIFGAIYLLLAGYFLKKLGIGSGIIFLSAYFGWYIIIFS